MSTSNFSPKHTLFVLITMLPCLQIPLHAQVEKGRFSIGLHNFSPSGINIDGVPVNLFGNGSMLGLSWGNSGFYQDGELIDESKSQYTLGVNLSAHYFPVDRLSIGAIGTFFTGFSAYTKESSEDGRYNARILLAGSEMRYYLGDGKTKTWIKASGSVGGLNVWWNKQKGKPTYLSKLAAGTGASFFVSQGISLDLGIEYNVFTLKLPSGIKGLNTNLALDLGFSLFF